MTPKLLKLPGVYGPHEGTLEEAMRAITAEGDDLLATQPKALAALLRASARRSETLAKLLLGEAESLSLHNQNVSLEDSERAFFRTQRCIAAYFGCVEDNAPLFAMLELLQQEGQNRESPEESAKTIAEYFVGLFPHCAGKLLVERNHPLDGYEPSNLLIELVEDWKAFKQGRSSQAKVWAQTVRAVEDDFELRRMLPQKALAASRTDEDRGQSLRIHFQGRKRRGGTPAAVLGRKQPAPKGRKKRQKSKK